MTTIDDVIAEIRAFDIGTNVQDGDVTIEEIAYGLKCGLTKARVVMRAMIAEGKAMKIKGRVNGRVREVYRILK